MASEDDTANPSEEPGELDVIDARKVRLVELLMEGASMAEAATELGYSARALWRWKNEPEVRALMKTHMAEGLRRARAVLTGGAVWASTLLVQIVTGEADPDAVKVQAARVILETAARLAESEDLSERIDDLEKQLSTNGQGNPQ